MFDKVPRHLVQPAICSDNMIVPLQFLLEALLYVYIIGLEFLQLLGNSLVQVSDGDTQSVASRVVVERYGCAILDCSLEVIG